MLPTIVSPQGELFTIGREACPEMAYKDVGGVVTVGPGLTMLSKVFSDYWRKTRGRALRVGDSLPRAEAIKIFRTVINEEYVPPVLRNIAPTEQHILDGSADVAWNAGTGATMWNWAKSLKAGRVAEATALLRKTAITVHGKVLQGLINRRAAQANLIEHGDYGAGPTVNTENGVGPAAGYSTTVDEVKEYQRQLTTLGYYKGDIDGKGNMVKGSLTYGAVQNFQRATPGLKVDGKVGAATRAALMRAVTAKAQGVASLGGGTVSGGGLLGLGHLDWWWIVGGAIIVVVLLIVAFWAWNNRGVILRKRTPV